MRKGVIEVQPQRYRETYGRYFEEFVVGEIYEHRPGRTITETDNIWFSLLTMNQHPAHCDASFAEKTEFGKPLVASPLTVAIMTGQSVSDVSQKAVANLGWKDIRRSSRSLQATPSILNPRCLKSATATSARHRASSPSRPSAGTSEARWSANSPV